MQLKDDPSLSVNLQCQTQRKTKANTIASTTNPRAMIVQDTELGGTGGLSRVVEDGDNFRLHYGY